jgi:general L-amino acid transport system permease protein
LPLLGWFVAGAPTAFSVPELKGFNFDGGTSWSPELFAILGALATYTSAYIAENTRAGILAVSHGQIEAGRSLGLSEGVIMRQVILPQALRVIVPPTTNQYLNLTKNSSLSVAIGYPDLVSIANTTLNQTGQAIECISIIMLVYLSTSLATSALMNWYNRSIRLVER